jgi:HD-like signal output (HDOD) protein
MDAAPAVTGSDAAVRLRQLQALAPLPVVARRLLQDLERDDLSLGQLASIIEMDPGLTARLVGLANSAYFASGRPVSSVTDAIGRVLGLDLVRNLALGIVLSGPFDTRRCSGFHAELFWFRAMGAATLAVPLSRTLGGPVDDDWVYLGGLLHELGLLALCALCPSEMSRVFADARQAQPARADPFQSRVRAALGLTPAEAGAVLARRWRLPGPVAVAMSHYAEPGYRGEYWHNNALVGLASAVALDLYHERDDSGGRLPWLQALGLSDGTVSDLVDRQRSRVESLRVLSSHMASA